MRRRRHDSYRGIPTRNFGLTESRYTSSKAGTSEIKNRNTPHPRPFSAAVRGGEGSLVLSFLFDVFLYSTVHYPLNVSPRFPIALWFTERSPIVIGAQRTKPWRLWIGEAFFISIMIKTHGESRAEVARAHRRPDSYRGSRRGTMV